MKLPASLRLTVPLILLGFAAAVSMVNLLYHVPRAEQAAEEESRKILAQEMSRLQSMLEYLLLRGDLTAAQHEIAVLAHNHDYALVALTDDRREVVASTRRDWLGRQIAAAFANYDPLAAAAAMRERSARVNTNVMDNTLHGYAGILIGSDGAELRPSRIGGLFLVYDLSRSKADARARVIAQSRYWTVWMSILALVMWLAFHFLLTRRTARLVHAAEQIAAGNLSARSALEGHDELARLSRAFDAMAIEVSDTQTHLRQDIAERQRTEAALRVSEASYRAIFDTVEDAIFVLDVEHAGIVDLNPKAGVVYGYSRDEMRQLDMGTLSSGAPGYTREDAVTLINRAIAGEQLQFEWHVRNKDGSLHWHEVFVKRVTIGGMPRIIALTREITGRKAAEAALRASEEQYRAMFNASIDGLALWNAAGEIVDTNPALWHMYGYGEGEVPAPPSAAPVHPTYPPEFLRSVAAGSALHIEITQLRKDGSALDLELHGVPMQYQGKPHVLTIARDVTDKKRSAEELTRQREMFYRREKLAALGSLLAGVAHELNNPLSVVVARSIMLEERNDPTTQAAAQKIRAAADRCARIVRTFLAMARQQQPERGSVKINQVVWAALDIAGYTLRASNVELALDLAKDMPPIFADADQLHQVLLNLVINAQQALQDQPGKRRIRVITRHDASADLVRIAVADNGPGIPDHLRARVFEPYFTTKPVGIGTGIGLAVSLGIVEAHGGTLTVECPLEGGTVFNMTLPASGMGDDPAHGDATSEPRIGARSVLVVDDDAEMRDTLADILSSARHHVVTVGSAREAMERLTNGQFDVILTDIRMPDRDGRALYQDIAQRWPEYARRVVFVTGDTLAATLREFAAEHDCPIIEKPFLPSDVRRVVGDIAARAVSTLT